MVSGGEQSLVSLPWQPLWPNQLIAKRQKKKEEKKDQLLTKVRIEQHTKSIIISK